MVSVQDNILFGGPVLVSDSGPFRSLGEYLIYRFKINPDNVMLVDAINDRKYTRKEVLDKVIRVAYILKYLGVKKGDIIGLCAENCIEYAVTMFAIFIVGAIAAPYNSSYSGRELDHAINLMKPKLIFCTKTPLAAILNVASKNKFIEKVIVFGDKSTGSSIAFDTLLNDKQIVSYPELDSPCADKVNDVALLVCSSGTTGMPKGVQLTQMNILSIVDEVFNPNNLQLSDIYILSVIPWFHSFGCLTLIMTMCSENVLVFLPKFVDTVFLGAIQKYQVAVAYMVPPLMVFLAKHPIIEKYDLSSLIVLMCGAAPLSKETEDAVKERIGVQLIRQGYGLSESTLSLTTQTDLHCKPGSIGSVRCGMWAKVVDTETGKCLGPNKRGELCFKGSSIMKGYIGDVVSSENVIRDGWLHTGDIGYYDDDLEFYIVDRIKELIKYKGFQVPPAEIEALLLTHPKIMDAAVIGKPDEAAGELPMAFVVKQPGVMLNEEDVIKFVTENASPAKKLRGGVIFINEIPKNPSGKILRRVLRDSLKNTKSKL